MAASDILSLLLGPSANSVPQQLVDANQEVMAQMYDSVAPFSLGTHTTQENKKRTRKEILTKWEQMLKFAPVAEGIGIHVMAALGGDTHTGQQIFITTTERLRGKLGKTTTGTITGTTNVIGGGKSLATHTHGGVQNGNGSTSPPI